MSQNKLKLNADKTEVLVLGTPKQRAKISVPSIPVNGEIVKILNIPIGNLGSVFDPSMDMAAHVSKAVKSENYHLRNIGRIRKYLTAESTKGAVISLVTSGFDYCNGHLCGIPEELICKLQRVQIMLPGWSRSQRSMTISLQYQRNFTGYQSGRVLNSRFFSWRTSVSMELHPLTWGKCWKSMSHHGHWDQHPRTYSASREPTWKPTVTDLLVPVPQNYGISSQIIFGQLGVWQSSTHLFKDVFIQ